MSRDGGRGGSGREAGKEETESRLPATPSHPSSPPSSYAVYDYEHTNSEGRAFNKLVFLNWAPDAAAVKAKMMYASTKDFFRGHLDGVAVELQASEPSDLDEGEVAAAVQATITRK